MQTIYILWLRQLKRYFRSKSRIIGSLGQPLLFLVALGFGFGPIYQKAGGGDYLQFLTPGIIAMTVMFTAMFSGMETIWDRQFGFLKETLVAPVSRLNIMFGKTLGGASVAILQGLIVFVISLLIGFRPHLLFLPMALVFMILIAFLFTALGTAIASKMEDMHGFQLIMNFLVMPIFFLSGALFPLNGTPKIIGWLIKINPLTYGVDGLRSSLLSSVHLGLLGDFTILLIAVLILLSIGAYLFSKIQI
jgi:ABC-2 type transport system permease protein